MEITKRKGTCLLSFKVICRISRDSGRCGSIRWRVPLPLSRRNHYPWWMFNKILLSRSMELKTKVLRLWDHQSSLFPCHRHQHLLLWGSPRKKFPPALQHLRRTLDRWLHPKLYLHWIRYRQKISMLFRGLWGAWHFEDLPTTLRLHWCLLILRTCLLHFRLPIKRPMNPQAHLVVSRFVFLTYAFTDILVTFISPSKNQHFQFLRLAFFLCAHLTCNAFRDEFLANESGFAHDVGTSVWFTL